MLGESFLGSAQAFREVSKLGSVPAGNWCRLSLTLGMKRFIAVRMEFFIVSHIDSTS